MLKKFREAAHCFGERLREATHCFEERLIDYVPDMMLPPTAISIKYGMRSVQAEDRMSACIKSAKLFVQRVHGQHGHSDGVRGILNQRLIDIENASRRARAASAEMLAHVQTVKNLQKDQFFRILDVTKLDSLTVYQIRISAAKVYSETHNLYTVLSYARGTAACNQRGPVRSFEVDCQSFDMHMLQKAFNGPKLKSPLTAASWVRTSLG